MTVSSTSSQGPGASPYLRTLGVAGLYATADQSDGPLIRPGKPLAMLAFLAHLPDRTATRDQLIDLLWSDMPVDGARHSLRQTIWAMRKQFGDSLVIADKRQVVLAPGVRCDRDDFIQAVERVDLERAVDLYGGHFLDRIGAVGGIEFDHWVDAERYHLALLLRRTTEVAIQSRLAQGQTRQAVRIAESVRKLDPGNQALVRLVIESKLADGEVVAARVESDALMDRLRRADRLPEPATQRVMKIARGDRHNRSEETGADAGNVISRPEAMAALIGAWNSAKSGTSQTLLLAGPEGSGKSTILGSFRQLTDVAGAETVLISKAAPQSHVEYGLASDLAGRLGSRPGALGVSTASASILLGLNPSLSARFHGAPDQTAPDERLRHRIAAVSELITTVAQEGPLALLVDDFEACDATSRQLIRAVAGALGDNPVLVVLSGRAVVVEPWMDHVFHIDPLTAPEIADYFDGAGLTSGNVEQIRRVTHGRPRDVIALASRLQDEGVLERSGSSWVCPDPERLADWLSIQVSLDRPPAAKPSFPWSPVILVLGGMLIGLVLGLLLGG